MTPETGTGCPENELGWLLELLHGLAATQVFHHMSRTMHAVDLSFSQILALFSLYRLGPQSITSLARVVHLSHAATSRLVDKLVREGLAHRGPNPADRRERLVRVGDQATAYLRDLQALTAQAYRDLLTDTPRESRERLRAILWEIRPHLPLQYSDVIAPSADGH